MINVWDQSWTTSWLESTCWSTVDQLWDHKLINSRGQSWSTVDQQVDQQMLINCYSTCWFFEKSYSTVTQQVEFWGDKLKKVTQLLINMLILRGRGINKLINCWVTSWFFDPKLLNSWVTSWILEGKVTQQLFNMLILKNSTYWSTVEQQVDFLPRKVRKVDQLLLNKLILHGKIEKSWSTVDQLCMAGALSDVFWNRDGICPE